MRLNDKFIYEARRTYQWPLMAKTGKALFHIRLWIKLENPNEDLTEFETDFLNYLSELNIVYATALSVDIANKFEKEIAAVEVIDMNGNGLVTYTSWP